jgi:hypothetical protein
LSTAIQIDSRREVLSEELVIWCCIDRLSRHVFSECGPDFRGELQPNFVGLRQDFSGATEECNSEQDVAPNRFKFFSDRFILQRWRHIRSSLLRQLRSHEFSRAFCVRVGDRSLCVPGGPIVSQNVAARASEARGRAFEPPQPHHIYSDPIQLVLEGFPPVAHRQMRRLKSTMIAL